MPQDRAEAARWFRKATEHANVRAENAETPPDQSIASIKPSRPANAAFVLTPEIIRAAVARGESQAKKGKNIYMDYRQYYRTPVREEYDKGKKRLQKDNGITVLFRGLGALPVVEASWFSSVGHGAKTIPAGLLNKDLTLTSLEFDVFLNASRYVSHSRQTYDPSPGSLKVDKFILLDDKGNSFDPMPDSTKGKHSLQSQTGSHSFTTPGEGYWWLYDVTTHEIGTTTNESMSYRVIFSMFDADGQPIIAPDVKKITLRLDDAFVEYDLKPLVFK